MKNILSWRSPVSFVLKFVASLFLFLFISTAFAVSPPSNPSISIDEGDFTNTVNVTLTLSADDIPTQMQFSCDGSTWTGWESYNITRVFDITAETGAGCTTGDGDKTITVQFKNTAGNSGTSSDLITLDQTDPVYSNLSVVSDNANPTTYAKAGDTLTFTLNISPADTWESGTNNVNFTIGATPYVTGNFFVSHVPITQRTRSFTITAGMNGILNTTGINFQDRAGNLITGLPTFPLGSGITVDTTTPTISQVTPVTNPTNDSTPDYVFISDEAGTISYSGACSGVNTTAAIGNNTVALDNDGAGGSLPDGTYSNCQIIVTDAAGNASSPLSIPSFEVDTTNPQFASLGVTSNNAFDPAYAKADSVLTFTLTLSSADSFNGPGPGTGQVRFTLNGGVEKSVNFTQAQSISTLSAYTANYDLATYGGVIPNGNNIQITGLDFQDRAGNLITGFPSPHTASPTVIIDTINPSLQQVSYTTTNANASWAKAGDTITYTVIFDEIIQFSSRTSNSVVTATTNLTLTSDFDLPTWGTNDIMTFDVVNGNNGSPIFTNANFIVVDQAGNTSTMSPTLLDNALNTWTSGPGTAIQADTTSPSMASVHIESNNVLDTALAKTNDTIQVIMTTNDNLSPTVSLVGGGHILNKAITGSSLGSIGAGKYVERFTDGTETSEVVVPFSFQIQDEAGNISSIKTTTDDASTVKFDRTDPIIRNVFISALSADLSAYLGDIPTYYAKQGDFLTLSFQTCDYVDVGNIAPAGTILGNAVTMTDGLLTLNSCTTPLGNTGTWHLWTTTMVNIDGPEGTVLFDILVYDNAGNGIVNVVGTTDGSTVIFDKTVPISPTTLTVADGKGAETIRYKHRTNAYYNWSNPQDDPTNTVVISGIQSQTLQLFNPVNGGELHKQDTLAVGINNWDATFSTLAPWIGKRIPPRNFINPYQVYMSLLDKAGNQTTLQNIYTQPYTIAVYGKVKKADGTPLYGVQVQIVSRYGEKCDTGTEVCFGGTNSNGDYSILVSKEQNYIINYYRINHYMSQEDIYVELDDKLINKTLQGLIGPKEWQTSEKIITLFTDTPFSDIGGIHKTKIEIKSLSGEISYDDTLRDGSILISSLSRITLVTSNNPNVQIIDNGDNTFSVLNAGNIQKIQNGESLSSNAQGVKISFASENSRLGVIAIPGSGKANSRMAGESRNSGIRSGKIWTEEESKYFAEKANKGIAGKVNSYVNMNGFTVFAGYQHGKIALSRYEKRFQNPIAYRGERRDLQTNNNLKAGINVEEKYQIAKRLFQKNPSEKEITEPKKKTFISHRNRSRQAISSVLAKKLNDKNKVNKFERKPLNRLKENTSRIRIAKDMQTVVFRINGKSLSMDRYLNQ